MILKRCGVQNHGIQDHPFVRQSIHLEAEIFYSRPNFWAKSGAFILEYNFSSQIRSRNFRSGIPLLNWNFGLKFQLNLIVLCFAPFMNYLLMIVLSLDSWVVEVVVVVAVAAGDKE